MQTGYTNSAAGTNGTQMAPPPPPPASEDSSDSTNDDTITSFLDKVVNGTVTDTDLEEMQTYLQNLSTESTESTTTGTQMAPPPHHRQVKTAQIVQTTIYYQFPGQSSQRHCNRH
jgi:hypothetical protein